LALDRGLGTRLIMGRCIYLFLKKRVKIVIIFCIRLFYKNIFMEKVSIWGDSKYKSINLFTGLTSNNGSGQTLIFCPLIYYGDKFTNRPNSFLFGVDSTEQLCNLPSTRILCSHQYFFKYNMITNNYFLYSKST
jgi:hypothetical protein